MNLAKPRILQIFGLGRLNVNSNNLSVGYRLRKGSEATYKVETYGRKGLSYENQFYLNALIPISQQYDRTLFKN